MISYEKLRKSSKTQKRRKISYEELWISYDKLQKRKISEKQYFKEEKKEKSTKQQMYIKNIRTGRKNKGKTEKQTHIKPEKQ